MTWKVNFKDPDTEKQYFLSRVSNKMLSIAANNLKLEEKIFWNPSSKKVKEWKEIFLGWPIQKFRQYLLPYYMSGRLTTHLYILEKVSIKRLEEITKNIETFVQYGVHLKDLHPEFFLSQDIAAILVKVPLKERYELVEENNQLLIKPIHPFEDIWVVFHINLGILEIRTSKSQTANRISKRLKNELRINCQGIKFTLDEMNGFFKWISSISNSYIRFETGAISSAHYTSAMKQNGTRDSLLGTDEFTEAMKKGRIISAYGHIPYSYLFSDIVDQDSVPNKQDQNLKQNDNENDNEDIDTRGVLKSLVGFNVNFESGKIYFATVLSEYEISKLIEQIVNLLDVESKRKLSPPNRQTKLNPSDLAHTL